MLVLTFTRRRVPQMQYAVSPSGEGAVLFDDAVQAWDFARQCKAWPRYRTSTDPTWRDLPDPDADYDPSDPHDQAMGPCCSTYPRCDRCMCNGWFAHHGPYWLFRILHRWHVRKVFGEE
jgi:hypothetical protein